MSIEEYGVGEVYGKFVFVTVEEVELSPDAEEWAAREWAVTLECEGRTMTFPWYGGKLVFEVSPSEIIKAVALDSLALFVEFEEWALELGFDEDSLAAYRTWERCREMAREFFSVLDVTPEGVSA